MGTYQPSLGQLAFGSKWERHEMPEFAEACFWHAWRELKRVFWNLNQREFDSRGHDDPQVPGLVVRPYWWGDCTCGYEEREAAWCEAHPHSPSCYQREYETLPADRKHSWSKDEASVAALCQRRGIPYNNGAGSAIHCDCGREKAWREWADVNDHDPECPTILPNFAFGGVQIHWYKWPGRGMSVNVDWTPEAWAAWLDKLLAAIRNMENP